MAVRMGSRAIVVMGNYWKDAKTAVSTGATVEILEIIWRCVKEKFFRIFGWLFKCFQNNLWWLFKVFFNHETDFADFILANGVFLTVILLILEWLCWFSAALGEWEWFCWFYSPQCCKCWIFTTLLDHLGEQLYGMADVSIMEIVAGNKTWYRGEHHQPQSQKTIADRISQHTLKIQKCHRWSIPSWAMCQLQKVGEKDTLIKSWEVSQQFD